MIKLKRYQLNLKNFASLFWIIGLVFCVMSTQVHATTLTSSNDVIQSTISGTVTSADDNMGIPGVNVLVKGTSNGAVTDFDGNYSISAPSNAVLVFSYLGFVTQEITIEANTTLINVTLESDLTSLDEVIVVGYGVAKKETLTGSIEQVKAEVFEDLAQGSAALALQGRTPGLTVTRSSSRPGEEEIDFLVRGATSINGISPLIVIDGVPAINAQAFNNMNPNDIESISVLKGGSASVYGARAAGGVILVTTKKGKGEVKVDVSSVLRIGTIGIRPPSPTMSQYGQLYLAAADEDIATGKPPRYFFWNNYDIVQRIANGEEGWYDLPINGRVWMANGNRFDEMFGNSYSSQHNVSISGGNERSNFRISAGYDKNVGGLKVADDSADRYNMSINYNTDISDRLSLTTNVTYFNNSVSGPQGGLDRDASTIDAPLFPTYTPGGNYYSVFGGVNVAGRRNAIAEAVDGGRRNNLDEQLKLYVQATYKITDDLNISGSYTYNKQNSEDQQYELLVPLYDWDDNFATTIHSNSFIEEETGSIVYRNYRGALNYKKSFGDHNVSGFLSIEAERNISNGLRARREGATGFIDYGVYDLNLGATDQVVETEGGGTTWGFYGYIGRINYDYKNKYLFELQGRRDGSSRFAAGSKWSNYFSVSGGWILSAEDFLKDSNVISFLKLRGGYGELGSTSGIGEFDNYLSVVDLNLTDNGNNILITPFGQTTAAQQTNSRASSLFSTSTSWERIENTEIGLDFKLFNNKIFGSIDLFKKKNVDMLVRGIIPQTVGASSPFTNIGTLENKGWEVILGWRDQIGEFDLAISANMSDTRNEITKYDGAQTIFENLNDAARSRNILGKPINSFYLWETDGYFDSQTEVDAYYASLTSGGILPSQTSNDALRPGDMRVVDSNGDGILNNDDLTYHGDANPHYVYGFNFDVKYKNWDLSAFFQGTLKHQIYRTGYFSQPFQAEWQNQSSTWLGRTWTEDNRNAEFPRLSTQRGISRWNYRSKDHILQNNKYIRLKQLVLGYKLPGIKIGNTEIDNARVYFSGNDLWEASAVKDGYDPETAASSNDGTYPFMRTWAFGVKFSI